MRFIFSAFTKQIKRCTKYILKLIITPFILPLLKIFNILIIYTGNNGYGDHLCMTPIIKEIFETYRYKIVIITLYPDFFYNLPYVWKIVELNNLKPSIKSIIIRLITLMEHKRVEVFKFKHEYYTMEEYVRMSKLMYPVAKMISMHFKIKLSYKYIYKNEIFLSKGEIEKYQIKFLFLPDKYAVVHSEGKKSYTPNKEWGADKFQQVINSLNFIRWVQVGLTNHTRLNNTMDLRGKTTIRELAYIINKAEFVVCLEGLYNHIASAFNTKSITIFSGFHPITAANYPNTVPVVRNPQVPCSPCMLLSPCPVCGKPCTNDIAPKTVIDTIRQHIHIN